MTLIFCSYLCIVSTKCPIPNRSVPSAVQAVLRVEGANIIPFTANNLNIFVSAVVAQLPNVTARDIVISQVGTALIAKCTVARVALLAHAWPLVLSKAFVWKQQAAAAAAPHRCPHGSPCCRSCPWSP